MASSIVTQRTLANDILGNTKKIVDEMLCSGHAIGPLNTYLLFHIAAKMTDLAQQSQFGTNYFRITPVNLTVAAVKIIDIEPAGLVRKVSIWIDSITGGPAPKLRISTGGGSAQSGGILVQPGMVNELGEVNPKQILFGSRTNVAGAADVPAYVIERA